MCVLRFNHRLQIINSADLRLPSCSAPNIVFICVSLVVRLLDKPIYSLTKPLANHSFHAFVSKIKKQRSGLGAHPLGLTLSPVPSLLGLTSKSVSHRTYELKSFCSANRLVLRPASSLPLALSHFGNSLAAPAVSP